MRSPTDPTREQLEAEVAGLRARVRELEARSMGPAGIGVALAQNAADNIMLLDRDGTIRYINWTVPDLTPEQVLGTKIFEYVAREFQELQRRTLERVARTATPDRYETAYVAGGGEISNWESRVAPIIEGSEVVGFTQISSNVTERRAAAADRDRFFNLSVDMLSVSGLDGYFKRINPAFEATLGWEPEELLSKPFIEFVHPDDRARTLAATAELERGAPVLGFENRYLHADGTYRTLAWQAVAEPDRGIAYAVARDVTAQRELEAELREAQTMEAIGRLAGGLAHDFNNLIMTVSANASFAEREANPALRKQFLEGIQQAAARAASLTRELLTVGQHQQLHLEAIDVSALVSEVVRLARQIISVEITLACDTPDDLPPLRVDREKIERVLLNLMLNARDAMPQGGTLSVSARLKAVDARFRRKHRWATHDTYVRITVSDTGPGIPPHLRERVFEPFFTTKEPGKGTGLGLATAYAIIQSHGGAIVIRSPERMGTHVDVYVPASTSSCHTSTATMP